MSKFNLLNSSCLKYWGESFLVSGVSYRCVPTLPTETGALKGIDIDYQQPTLSMIDTEAAPLHKGDTLTLRGRNYDIVNILPDGHGFVKVE